MDTWSTRLSPASRNPNECARWRSPSTDQSSSDFRNSPESWNSAWCSGSPNWWENDVYNCAVFIDHTGHICGKYHKMQLAEGYHADWWFNRLGKSCRAIDTPLGRCAILICNDRWNPQLAEIARLDGAQLLVIPAFGSRSKSQDEAVLNRGLEMGVPVVEANVGVSLVVDQGRIVAVERQEVGITYANVTIPTPRSRDIAARNDAEREFLAWRNTEMRLRYEKTVRKSRAAND